MTVYLLSITGDGGLMRERENKRKDAGSRGPNVDYH